MRKPNLFIVGAAKSGTSALWLFLRQHPDIFMSKLKEPRFFCKDKIEESERFYKENLRLLNKGCLFFRRYLDRPFFQFKTEEDYLSLFANWKTEKIAGEASPIYLDSEVAAREIYSFNPDAKVIIMLRDPVEFMYSAHSQELRANETVKDFKKALSLEEERRKGKHLPKFSPLSLPSILFYSERAKFTEQIERYYDVFDPKQIKVIIYDDFKKDNAKVYWEVLEFLGVDPSFTPKFESVNVNKKSAFPKLKMLLKSSLLSSLFARMYSVPRYFLPPKLFTKYTKLKRFIYQEFLLKKQPRDPMDPDLRRKLMEKFKPEVKRLSRLVGKDLVVLWGYNEIE